MKGMTEEGVVVEEGRMTAEVEEAEGRRQLEGEVEATLPPHLRSRSWRKSQASLFSLAASGNPGSGKHCPAAAARRDACRLTARQLSCYH